MLKAQTFYRVLRITNALLSTRHKLKEKRCLEMAISKEKKNEIIKEYALHEGDTGSPEVQNRCINIRNQPLK